ncbi:hypothetical protein [Mangrovibacterium lignilyticum]|uniref:hypothetical protein n=1 Tax=Mangrovibacterium lignilyticum TaxID=2668052 RepID=UPI0013D2ABFF|nr:hypothetical protein [Mangrovibacterium lignilyticum]
MKALHKFLFVAFSIGLLLACSNSQDEILSGKLKSANLGADKSSEVKMVTVPFKATFTVWRALPPGTGECEPGSARETMMMKGSGQMAHLGQIKEIYMTFCVISDGSYSFVEPGKFVAANGDELYFIGEGQVLPYTGDNVEYQAQFNDEFSFIGGTGRFEGASGSAKTNAYVHAGSTDNEGDDPFYTDFFITDGTITLKKGN